MIDNKINSKDIKIAKLFVFLLPFRMFTAVLFISDYLGSMFMYVDVVLHMLGIYQMIMVRRYRKTNQCHLYMSFCKVIYFWITSSCVMSIYTYLMYGSINNDNAVFAVFRTSLFLVQYIMIIYYCIHALSLINYKDFVNIIHYSLLTCLLIGYIQILSIYGISVASVFHRTLASIFNLVDIESLQRVSITFIEPSHTAMYLGIIVFPFYFSQILYNKVPNFHYLVEIILWMPIVFLTKSTTAYFIVFPVTMVGLLWIMRIKKYSLLTFIMSMIAIVGVVTVISSPKVVERYLGFNFGYLVYDKVTDANNQSTVERTLPLYMDWQIFRKYPLFGCGNGLQGYYYDEYIQQFNLSINNTRVDSERIANGQLFFPGILSGYGMVGLTMFVSFLVVCVKRINANRYRYRSLFYFYILSLIGIIISGFKSEFVGVYFIWFVLSIPMFDGYGEK